MKKLLNFHYILRSLECIKQVKQKPRNFKGSSQYKESHKSFKNKESRASLAQRRFIEASWMKSPGFWSKTTHALRCFLENYFHVSDLRFVKSNQVSSILGAIRRISHPVN